MTAKKETVQQFNEQLDEVIQNKPYQSNINDENSPLWALSDTLRNTDFSDESQIRHSLRQRLMNNLVAQKTPQNRTWSWPRPSVTWLVAIFTVIIAGTILMSIQSNDSPSYSSLIQQPQNTATTEPVLLTLTPMVGDTNATIMAMPSVTPGSNVITYTIPMEDIFTTYYISSWPANTYQVVVIATQDIPAGMELEADMLTEALIPIEFAPRSGYSSVELVVGLTVEDDISQWAPIPSISFEFDDLNHVAIAIPPDSPISEALQAVAEGEQFSITGTFRFVDIDESMQEIPAFATILPSESEVDGEVQTVSEEIVSDAVVLWNSYWRDFRGCVSQPTAIDTGSDEFIPINSPARYPCYIIVTMPPQDAVVFTWALDSQIPMTVGPVESDE